MKIIKLFFEGKEAPVTIQDEDSSDLDLYTKNISKIFDVNKIAVLKTTAGNFVMKPSKVSMIEINEKIEHIDSISD